MESIRVLHVMGAMNLGGAEVLLMDLYRNIDREKVQFDFLLHTKEKGVFDEEIKGYGGRIYYLNNRFYSNPFKYFSELRKFFIAHKEHHIIHSHTNNMSGYILWMAKKYGSKLTIAHSHNNILKADLIRKCVWYIGRNLIHKNADKILGCSNEAIDYMLGVNKKLTNHSVFRNAIQVNHFKYSSLTRQEFRKELGINDKNFVIGNVASFKKQKNHEFILKVFKNFLEINKNAILLLIGNGTLRSSIETMAKDMSIKENIKFLGGRNDVNKIYNAMDVFFLPSLYEGLGIVIIEAQANGLTCVVSDTVPKEADVHAGLVKFLSLEDNIDLWTNALKSASRTNIDPQKAVIEAGYEIKKASLWLHNFYTDMLKKN